jgi:hypothetical protein
MKKVILIVAVIVVALVGLTSYNGTDKKKDNGNGNLIAELKTGGTIVGSKKKE